MSNSRLNTSKSTESYIIYENRSKMSNKICSQALLPRKSCLKIYHVRVLGLFLIKTCSNSVHVQFSLNEALNGQILFHIFYLFLHVNQPSADCLFTFSQ